jgi:RNA polymerase sigma-70 factor (ECF subfamily)
VIFLDEIRIITILATTFSLNAMAKRPMTATAEGDGNGNGSRKRKIGGVSERDAQLIKRARNKRHPDKQAYDELVGYYRERLFAAMKQLYRDPNTAEDKVQDAFTQAYIKLHTFKFRCAFYTWLYRIAFNLAYSEGRRQKARPSSCSLPDMMDEHDSMQDMNSPAPDEELIRAENKEMLQKAMAMLSEEHRTVIVLRHFEEMSYEDIAEMIQENPGTVRSRLHRARAQLLENLQILEKAELHKAPKATLLTEPPMAAVQSDKSDSSEPKTPKNVTPIDLMLHRNPSITPEIFETVIRQESSIQEAGVLRQWARGGDALSIAAELGIDPGDVAVVCDGITDRVLDALWRKAGINLRESTEPSFHDGENFRIVDGRGEAEKIVRASMWQILPDELRIPLDLWLQGYSYRSIAMMLSAHPTSIGACVERALERVAKDIEWTHITGDMICDIHASNEREELQATQSMNGNRKNLHVPTPFDETRWQETAAKSSVALK